MWTVYMTCSMHLDRETTKQEVYVVKGLDLALVRLPAIEALNLVAKICMINTDKETFVSRFPKLFSGLGCLTLSWPEPPYGGLMS